MHLLVVEDNAGARVQLEKSLTQFQHSVVWAVSAREALEHIGHTQVDMLIVKRILPEINGLELCQKVRELKLSQYLYVLIVYHQDGRNEAGKALGGGADDVLVAPFEQEELQVKLTIASRVIHLERDLTQKLLAIKRNYYQTIRTLAQLMDVYNERVGAHCARVGQLALAMAKRHVDVKPEEYPVIEAAGLVHDIGLIGLPMAVLDKRRTELVGDEPDQYRGHAERGEKILSHIDLLRPVARLVRMHHEQYNGRGFPDGLAAGQIPMGARIVAAASIYDDLVYRERIPLEQIPEQLQQYRGYQLAPEMVSLLIEFNVAMQQEETQRDDRHMRIVDLKAGMVLARDVLMKSGAFLMAADTQLDEGILQKLKRYHEMGNISDKVFVKK
jgi:response regulator RpfG family c-di-GMP phosphodiesterase